MSVRYALPLRLGADAVSTIKRSDFGLTRALGLVGDNIDLSFQVTAFRAPQ